MFDTYYLNRNDNTIICTAIDEYPDSPREWDNISTLLTWENGYYSPDKNDYVDFETFMEDMGVDFDIYEDEIEDKIDDLVEVAEQNGIILFPVYQHGYSGYEIEYNLDGYGSLVGVMFADKDYILKNTYITENDNIRERVQNCFNAELDDYNLYVNNEIMQYAVYDLLGNCKDSCCGFFGLDINENGIKEDIDIDNSEELGEFNSINECLGHLISKGILEVKLAEK